MLERKPDWLEEALDQVADIDIQPVDLSTYEWPVLDINAIEWPTFDLWGDDNGEA